MTVFLGARPYDFTDEKSGNRISGVSVHFAERDLEGVTGYVSDKVSMSHDAFAQVFGDSASVTAMVMKPVKVDYNKYGKPTSVTVIQQK
jgi:hypothetical protein